MAEGNNEIKKYLDYDGLIELVSNTKEYTDSAVDQKSQVQIIESGTTEVLSTLEIYKITQEEYDKAVADGTLIDNAIYLTPDEDIDLSPYATIEQLKEVTDDILEINGQLKDKADQLSLDQHIEEEVHITSDERTKWNDAKDHADTPHAPSDAEVNQNAFSNVVVGSTTITAESKTDSLTLEGNNVTLTPDATNDKVTIGITKENVTTALGYIPPETDTTYSVATSDKAGLVKSGTDITVDDSGNVTVNDDSHKHKVSNISDLTATASELNIMDGVTAKTTEINCLSGVTSSIQEQLDGKSDDGHEHNVDEIKDLIASATELNYMKDVKDGVQVQLDGKVSTSTTINNKPLTSNITLSYSDVDADKSGTAEDKVSNHNNNETAHNDIRKLIQDLTEDVTHFLDVDAETVDQLSEVLQLIEDNKGTLESLTTSKVNVSDIIDNLETAMADRVLSAKQGVVIKELIDGLQLSLDNHKKDKENPHNVTLTQLGVSATASELNVLDGIKATTTELNYVDGVTSSIQNQLDSKSALGHVHTDVHYTKEEVDELLSQRSAVQIITWEADD